MRGFSVSWVLLLGLGCGPGPLPSESPKTELAGKTPDIPILVESTSDREEPPKCPCAEAGQATSKSMEETPLAFSGMGLSEPVAVLYEPASDRYLVANLGPIATGNYASFISLLHPNGELERLKFITDGEGGATLKAPRGLAAQGGVLYVADVDHVHTFDLSNGAPLTSVHLAGATSLGALALNGGAVYVTDTRSVNKPGKGTAEPIGTVFRIVDGEVSIAVKDKHLGAPAGLAILDDQLLVVDSARDRLAAFSISPASSTPSWTLALPGRDPYGFLVLPGPRLAVGIRSENSVFMGELAADHQAVLEPVVEKLNSLAGIGYDSKRQRLLLALPEQNEVRAIRRSLSSARSE